MVSLRLEVWAPDYTLSCAAAFGRCRRWRYRTPDLLREFEVQLIPQICRPLQHPASDDPTGRTCARDPGGVG